MAKNFIAIFLSLFSLSIFSMIDNISVNSGKQEVVIQIEQNNLQHKQITSKDLEELKKNLELLIINRKLNSAFFDKLEEKIILDKDLTIKLAKVFNNFIILGSHRFKDIKLFETELLKYFKDNNVKNLILEHFQELDKDLFADKDILIALLNKLTFIERLMHFFNIDFVGSDRKIRSANLSEYMNFWNLDFDADDQYQTNEKKKSKVMKLKKKIILYETYSPVKIGKKMRICGKTSFVCAALFTLFAGFVFAISQVILGDETLAWLGVGLLIYGFVCTLCLLISCDICGDCVFGLDFDHYNIKEIKKIYAGLINIDPALKIDFCDFESLKKN